MAIAPVSGAIFANNRQSINFGNRRKQNEEVQYPYQGNSSYELRKVPVILMIALSPISTGNSQARVPEQNMIMPEIENVQQNRSGILSQQTVETGYQKCTFIQYNNDNNRNNSELLAFKYSYLSEGGFSGLLDGFFQAVCPTPNKDGSYLVTYVGVTDQKLEKEIRTCSVPAAFGKYLLNYAKSNANNNSVDIAKKERFENVYGTEYINNIPPIKDEINRIKEYNGRISKLERPSLSNLIQPKVKYSEFQVLANDTKITKNEKMEFKAYDTNNNYENFEMIGFDYACKINDVLTRKNKGIFQAICPEKTPDGRYIIVCSKQLYDGSYQKNMLRTVNGTFGKYLLDLARSPLNNNAVVTLSKNELISAFGKTQVNNALPINK